MPSLPIHRLTTRVVMLVVMAGIVPALACSDGDDDGARGTTTTSRATTTTAPGIAPTPKASASEALEALLAAEQEGDHETSFRLLAASAREEYPDPPRWARRRNQLPPVTAFTIESSSSPTEAVAVVEHEPGLDPFIGLSAARERQTWRATQEGGGWLLEVEPVVNYLLPPDDAARQPALRWAEAVQACDQERAVAEQALEEVYGTSAAADELCGTTGELQAGEVSEVQSGPASADLVAQYSSDVFSWARVVTITGTDPTFGVVLAPIGDVWKVVGVQD